jgi:hypothetical protein
MDQRMDSGPENEVMAQNVGYPMPKLQEIGVRSHGVRMGMNDQMNLTECFDLFEADPFFDRTFLFE